MASQGGEEKVGQVGVGVGVGASAGVGGKEKKVDVVVIGGELEVKREGSFGRQLQNPSRTFILIWIVLFCGLGMGLTFINKLCVLAFPYPHTLLVIQCVVAVILLLAVERIPALKDDIKVDPLRLHVVIRWIPLVILFIGLLASSLHALKFVTVSTLVVIRNGSSLLVALMESTILKQPITAEVVVSLIGIFIGSIIYAISDFSFHLVGYGFLVINLISTSGYQIYVKKLIADFHLSPFGMAYYNNLLSLVYFIIAALVSEDPFSIHWRDVDNYTWFIIIASAVFGFALSLTAFVLNIVITATSQMVINNLNKVVLIFLSEWFQKNMDLRSGTSAVVVLVSGFYYSYAKTVKSPSISFHKLNKLLGLVTIAALVVFLLLPSEYYEHQRYPPYAQVAPLRSALKERRASLNIASLSFDNINSRETQIWLEELRIPTRWNDFNLRHWNEGLDSRISFEKLLTLCPSPEHLKKKIVEEHITPVVDDVDAFYCGSPASLCELFIPFKKPIIMHVGFPLEFGRESEQQFHRLLEEVIAVANDSKNIVAVTSRYLQQYIYYFTKIQAPLLLSLASHVKDVYNPTIKEFLLSASLNCEHWTSDLFSNEKVNFRWLQRDKIPLHNIPKYKAVIYIPHAPSSHDLYEFYAMGVPIFAPSVNLMLELQLCMKQRIFWSKASVQQPFLEHNPNSRNPTDSKWWIEYSDIYQLPNIQHFESLDDLYIKLEQTNFISLSNEILNSYEKLEKETYTHWGDALGKAFSSGAFASAPEKTILDLTSLSVSCTNITEELSLDERRPHSLFVKI